MTGSVAAADAWNSPEYSRLWLYNLHYFDDLNAAEADARAELHRELVGRWIDENPPFSGVGWEPYPCSLRIVNWIKWVLAGNVIEDRWRGNLALQAAWLEKHIEWHLLGNHLFANAKALIFAGAFFEGESAKRWLRKGLKILGREIPEQVLEDGGQFELSPMYHALAVEDMLDLVNLARTCPDLFDTETINRWRTTAEMMIRWASVMRHPDGQFPLFNDSAYGIAPDFDELVSYARRLDLVCESATNPVEFLEASGYVRAEAGDAVLFADIGRIGPDYLPAHAHADSLGFELSLLENRWFVDTGCSTYDVSDERLRQRGTAAHNTVVVDAENSSEVWSSFRVARRANFAHANVESNGELVKISAAHDGYRRLRGRVVHSRTFLLEQSKLVISDLLDGEFREAAANFLVHPGISVEARDSEIVLRSGEIAARLSVDGGRIRLHDSSWHPEFGMSVPTTRINVLFTQHRLDTTLTWE